MEPFDIVQSLFFAFIDPDSPEDEEKLDPDSEAFDALVFFL